MWGQADATYVAPTLGALYFTLRRKPWLACVFFGLALAFKLQAVFVFPVLLVLVLRKRLTWASLLAIPGVYVLLDIPALLVGASPRDVFLVYFNQVAIDVNFAFTTPNIYQFIGNPSSTGEKLAIIGTGVLLLAATLLIALRRIDLTDERVVLAITVVALVVPFLLPRMRERYFYLAEVLTLVAAFWVPRRLWYTPVLVQFASVFAYLPFLLLPYRMKAQLGDIVQVDADGFTTQKTMLLFMRIPPEAFRPIFGPVIDFRILALAVLVAVIATVWTAVRRFSPSRQPLPEPSGEPVHDPA
jgi:Gpi18-like mannosyltransferase